MRSQDSAHSSSQYAVRNVLEDTASSTCHTRRLPGESMTISSVAPTSTFARWRTMSRARSTSLGSRRSPSPLGVLVVQHHAKYVEQTAETAMSAVGCVVEETRHVRGVAEAAIAEANSVHDAVESKVASLMAYAKASTAHITGVLSKRVEEVAAHSEAQVSRVAEVVTQQLEKEIQAAVTSTAMTAKVQMCIVVEGMRRDVQAQIEQNRMDTQHRDKETQRSVQQIEAGLAQLNKQLNKFRPVSEKNVGDVQK